MIRGILQERADLLQSSLICVPKNALNPRVDSGPQLLKRFLSESPGLLRLGTLKKALVGRSLAITVRLRLICSP